MADIMVLAGDSNPYHTTEHYLRKVLVGDVASVRIRIISALERLGYDLLDDEDLTVRGRRGASGWGTFHSSADVLDYPRTLVIKLKAAGDHATRVTFDYVVKHPYLSKGEKDILTREAEAISSLATVRKVEKICPTCGTESTDDSRFCRKCGTPMTVESTELEMLNMAAEIRAGYTSVVTSEIVMAATTIALAISVLSVIATQTVLNKGIWTFMLIALGLSVLNMIFIGFGWNRMSRSLKRKPRSSETIQPGAVLNFPASVDSYLPEPPSVIEGTTSLLDPSPNRTQPIEFAEVQRKRVTLSDLDRQE